MGLQLKGDDEVRGTLNVRPQNEPDMEDPWESGRLIDENYHTSVLKSDLDANIYESRNTGGKFMQALAKLVVVLMLGVALIVTGKWIISIAMPEGRDITNLLKTDEAALASELGVTFKDSPDWISRIHQYSTGKVSVKAAEDIGIIYIDGRQVGIQVESKQYTMFGVQVGEGEKHAYDTMKYKFDNFHSVIDDMARGRTTTYYYYNEVQNDCLVLTINDSTNRIVGLTYFTDYKLITATLN